MINYQKFARLIANKRAELGMTQREFTHWFNQQTGQSISYGSVQTWEKPDNVRHPHWENMKGVARIYGLTLDELDLYLTNDDLELDQVSEALKLQKKSLQTHPENIVFGLRQSDKKTKLEAFKYLFFDLTGELEANLV